MFVVIRLNLSAKLVDSDEQSRFEADLGGMPFLTGKVCLSVFAILPLRHLFYIPITSGKRASVGSVIIFS